VEESLTTDKLMQHVYDEQDSHKRR